MGIDREAYARQEAEDRALSIRETALQGAVDFTDTLAKLYGATGNQPLEDITIRVAKRFEAYLKGEGQ